MNSVVIGFALLTVSTSVGGAAGGCVHVKNDDMLEYSCVGGHPGDLNEIPSRAEKIRISDMRIPRITADMFLRFGPTLWVLSCSHCDIADIEPNALRALINLQQLSLDNNRLTTVKASWFEGFEYLTYLDLNYNQITTIEDAAFENLASLVDLRLSGNRLECLNLRAMERLRHLKRMFLSENPEFKCPNAISKFLADREVSFDRDPQWKDTDRVSVIEVPSTTEEKSRESPTYWSTVPSAGPAVSPNNGDSTTSRLLDSTLDFSLVATTDESDVSQYHRAPIEDPYTSEIATVQPSWYPTTRPWTSVREDENEEYYKRIGYSDETIVTTPLAASPTDRGGSSPLLDPRDTPSTRQPEIYSTSDLTLSEPNYPPFRNPSWDSRLIEDAPTSKPSYVLQSLAPPPPPPPPPPPSPPKLVQPASPTDFLQVPYYEPTVTVHRPLSSPLPPVLQNLSYKDEDSTMSQLPLETTTDVPLPQCPRSSSPKRGTLFSNEMIVFLFIIFLANVLV